jgi:hypothetical protein
MHDHSSSLRKIGMLVEGAGIRHAPSMRLSLGRDSCVLNRTIDGT